MKTQSTTKGFAILSAAGMIVKLISLLYVPLLLNIIGEEGYGIYYIAYSVFAFIYVVTNTGLTSAISKLVSELIAFKNYKDAVKSFKMARLLLLLIGTIMSILMITLARPLAVTMNKPKAYLAIAALAPAVLLTSVASAYRGYFQGRGNMTATAVSQVLEQIMNITFSLLFAVLWSKYGVEAACAGGTVGTTIGALVSVVYLLRYYKKNKAFKVAKGYINADPVRYSNEQLVKKLLNYATPLTINWGLQNAGSVIDNKVTTSRLLASGFNDIQASVKVSHLAKYQTLINVPITVISALCASILPVISGAAVLDDRKEVKRGIDYAFKICFLIAIPAAVGLAVLSNSIFQSIYPRYSEGAVLMRYGAIVLIFMAVVQIQATILQGIGKLYLSTLYIVIGIAVKILVNYILIARPSINILGAVYGSMIGFLIPILLNNFIIKRSLKIRYNLILLSSKPFIAASIMGLVAFIVEFIMKFLLSFISKGYLTGLISTLVAVIAAIIVYVYVLILIGGITKQELGALPAKIKRFIPKRILKKIN